MADPIDGLPPTPAPIVEPTPTPTPEIRRREEDRRHKIICEFCESHLTPYGHAMELSEKAKKFRDLKDRNDKLTAKIDELERQLAEQTAKARELQTAASKKTFFK